MTTPDAEAASTQPRPPRGVALDTRTIFRAEGRRSQRWLSLSFAVSFVAGLVVFLTLRGSVGVFLGLSIAASGGFVLATVSSWYLSQGRIAPASDVLWFTGDRFAQLWGELDGRAITTVDHVEALARVGDRDDDLGLYLRSSELWRYGDLEGLRVTLEMWQPKSNLAIARRARLEDRLAFVDGPGDLDGVRRAIGAIPDDADRVTEEAALALEECRRIMIEGGDDPLEPLVAVRPHLGRTFELPIMGRRRSVARMRQLVPSVICIALLEGGIWIWLVR